MPLAGFFYSGGEERLFTTKMAIQRLLGHTGMQRNLAHAGRSDDVVAALDMIAAKSKQGPMLAIGVSLGAGQLLRAVGRIGCGVSIRPAWFERLARIAVVAPPLDLRRCSVNMQRWLL